MKKFLSMLVLSSMMTSAFAAEKFIRCLIVDDQNGPMTFLMEVDAPSAKVLLVIDTEEGEMTIPLPAEASRVGRFTNVDVGFFMGALRFEVPNNLGTRSTKVKVTGSSEGSVTVSEATCSTAQ